MFICMELLTLPSISFIFELIEGEVMTLSGVTSGDDLVVASRSGVTSIFYYTYISCSLFLNAAPFKISH